MTASTLKTVNVFRKMACVPACLLLLPGPAIAGLESDPGQVARVELSLSESGLASSCNWHMVAELRRNGFSVIDDPERMDGVLIVDIKGTDRAIGHGADFTAELQGKGDEVIWKMHGRKNSLTAENLCEDVADSVVHHLEDFRDDMNRIY